MLHGVLFDLDGTLLDVDIDEFLHRYFGALKAFAQPHFPGVDLLSAVLAGTHAMQRPHEGQTNLAVFASVFGEITGVDIEQAWDGTFAVFYRDVFPTLGADYGPNPGALSAIRKAQELGLKVAIATQPIFPLAAIEHRLAWAGLSELRFDAVTTYEHMTACKPLPAYFVETAKMIGCEPQRCLMVGDDRGNDMPASATGMLTYYVGADPEASSDFRGSLEELPALLERLAGA